MEELQTQPTISVTDSHDHQDSTADSPVTPTPDRPFPDSHCTLHASQSQRDHSRALSPTPQPRYKTLPRAKGPQPAPRAKPLADVVLDSREPSGPPLPKIPQPSDPPELPERRPRRVGSGPDAVRGSDCK